MGNSIKEWQEEIEYPLKFNQGDCAYEKAKQISFKPQRTYQSCHS